MDINLKKIVEQGRAYKNYIKEVKNNRLSGIKNLVSVEKVEDVLWEQGVYDYRWSNYHAATLEGFVAYVKSNYSEIDKDDFDRELATYIRSEGEDPKLFDLIEK